MSRLVKSQQAAFRCNSPSAKGPFPPIVSGLQLDAAFHLVIGDVQVFLSCLQRRQFLLGLYPWETLVLRQVTVCQFFHLAGIIGPLAEASAHVIPEDEDSVGERGTLQH